MSNRIAIVGSRGFSSERSVRAYVARLPLSTVIVSGGAAGPDSWAESEAIRRGMKAHTFKPERIDGGRWVIVERLEGLVAGFPRSGMTSVAAGSYPSFGQAAYARNAMIVANADAVIAFWDGQSRGTMNTIDLAHKAKLPFAVLTMSDEDTLHVTSTEPPENLWLLPREGH